MQSFSTGGNYINFQTADEDQERIEATYGDNHDRLTDIKEKYDPENFRKCQNLLFLYCTNSENLAEGFEEKTDRALKLIINQDHTDRIEKLREKDGRHQ